MLRLPGPKVILVRGLGGGGGVCSIGEGGVLPVRDLGKLWKSGKKLSFPETTLSLNSGIYRKLD